MTLIYLSISYCPQPANYLSTRQYVYAWLGLFEFAFYVKHAGCKKKAAAPEYQKGRNDIFVTKYFRFFYKRIVVEDEPDA
jgi:hypothetical protein